MTIVTFSFIAIVILFVFIIESVRRGILETNYALIWIAACVVMGILSSNNLYINAIAKWLHVYYAPSVLFLFGFFFLIIMVFDLTRRLSKINEKLTALAQAYAILQERYEKEQKSK